MNNITLSVLGNKILLQVLREVKLFSKYNIKGYENLSLCIKETSKKNNLIILFLHKLKGKDFKEMIKHSIPLIVIDKYFKEKNNFGNEFIEKLAIPFNILHLERKIVSLMARYEFNQRSLINLYGYKIDKNERKIIKENLELKLTEKEVNFLTLFSQSKQPITRSFILKNVWNYSSESETHTVETHIHRLRKKIASKFGDNNFIKNTNKGYYI